MLKVIYELHYSVYSIFESLDINVIRPDLASVLLNQLLHMFLPRPEIIYYITQICIDLVIMLQILVHLIGLLLQPRDLHFSRCYVPLQFLDLIVQHELELLQLLRLLLQLINLLLPLSDRYVLVPNLSRLLLYLVSQCRQRLCLVSQLCLLVLDISLELFNV